MATELVKGLIWMFVGIIFGYACWFTWQYLGVKKFYYLNFKKSEIRHGLFELRNNPTFALVKGEEKVALWLANPVLADLDPYVIGLVEEKFIKEVEKDGIRKSKEGQVEFEGRYERNDEGSSESGTESDTRERADTRGVSESPKLDDSGVDESRDLQVGEVEVDGAAINLSSEESGDSNGDIKKL